MREKEVRRYACYLSAKRQLGTTTRNKASHATPTGVVRRRSITRLSIAGPRLVKGESAIQDQLYLGRRDGPRQDDPVSRITSSLIYERSRRTGDPALVCGASGATQQNWERELEKWCSDLHVWSSRDRPSARDVCKDAEFDKTRDFTSASRRTRRLLLRNQPLEAIGRGPCPIVDEGSLPEEAGVLARLFRELHDLDSAFRVLLTGTPLQNSLDELYHLSTLPGPGERQEGARRCRRYDSHRGARSSLRPTRKTRRRRSASRICGSCYRVGCCDGSRTTSSRA